MSGKQSPKVAYEAILGKGEEEQILDKLKQEPVGGLPGNHMFKVYVELSIRGTVFALLLALVVWSEVPWLARFKAYVPLAICIFLFTINPIFGQVVDNASAGIIGTFAAFLNIFIMRGFFAEGVDPNKGPLQTAAIVGWVDFFLFDLYFLLTNSRMATRMFAMACHTGFMLAFLNPEDTTPYSKNFKLDINGTAFSAFLGISLGSVLGILAMCLPYPWQFAYSDMKHNAEKCTADTCRLFIHGVNYFRGSSGNVLIEQQMAQLAELRARIDGMGGSIGAAWNETFDIGKYGKVRALMQAHQDMLNKIYDILYSMMIAMAAEDFGASHTSLMKDIENAAVEMVERTGILLVYVTRSASDGNVDGGEKADIEGLIRGVQQSTKQLAMKFDSSRKKFGPGVSEELLSESFFVFSLSCYGRQVVEYATMLISNPPQGVSVGEALKNGAIGTFKWPGTHHDRFTIRYGIGLMLCMIFSCTVDKYRGACAVMAVFLINTRVGPDMMATLNTMLAIVIGSVVGGVIYSYSCMSPHGWWLLPFFTAIYWLITIFIAYSGSSFGLIGLFMCALAPFYLVKECPSGVPSDTGAAGGLWIGIRGTIIAMAIMSTLEFLSVPGEQSKLAVRHYEDAFNSIIKAFHDLWDGKDPSEAIGPVSGDLGSASTFCTGAKLEPRMWKCKWKAEFCAECISYAGKIRVDLLTIRRAIENNMEKCLGIIDRVPEIKHMEEDLMGTLDDAKVISVGLLNHECGMFHGLEKLKSFVGIDQLDGFSTAITGVNKALLATPAVVPDSMEDDLLCQLSIVFIMLDYSIKHTAGIIKASIAYQV